MNRPVPAINAKTAFSISKDEKRKHIGYTTALWLWRADACRWVWLAVETCRFTGETKDYATFIVDDFGNLAKTVDVNAAMRN